MAFNDKAVEFQFLRRYDEANTRSIRFGLILGFIAFGAFACVDNWALPLTHLSAQWLRVLVPMPVIALMYGFTFTRSYPRFSGLSMFVACFCATISILAITARARPSEIGYDHYYVGVILVNAWLSTVSRLRFRHAALIAVGNVVAYLIVAYAFQDYFQSTDPSRMNLLLTNCAFLITTSFVSAFGCYLMESAARKNFQQEIEIEQALENNKSLIHILCHDLNNAIHVVDATSRRALSHQTLDAEENRVYWERVRRAIRKETDIISQVRQMVAVDSGKSNVEMSSVNLQDIIESARFIFSDKLREKNLDFESNIKEPFYIYAEPVSLSNSVFNNLISNAIKFSKPNGKIFVEAMMAANDEVVVKIKDSGVGIPPQLIHDIFLPNKKTTRRGTAGETGTGFGMPLVKSYLKAYGGTIRIESISEEDKAPHESSGTTMVLSFKTRKKAA